MSELAEVPASRLSDHDWKRYGVCAGRSELFFAPHRERPAKRELRERQAVALCAACPVCEQCREAGRTAREIGIWGGETEEDRARAGFPIRTYISKRILDAGRAQAGT